MPQPRPAEPQREDARDAELQMLRAQLAHLRLEREIILNSTLWRATKPVRMLARAVPPGMRRMLRRALGQAPGEAGSEILDDLMDSWHSVSPRAYAAWIRSCDTLTDDDRDAIKDHIVSMRQRPVISVIMPAYETPEALLREAIASVRRQLYPHWELCIADDGSPSPHVARIVEEFAAKDTRIKFVRCGVNGNISAATNAALALASGTFVALLDHDDVLAEHALYEVAAELEIHPDADLIYSDEDHIDAAGKRHSPYFKPDWNIDLMLGHNLVNHLCVFRRALIEKVGGMRLGFEGSQDYDLALRVIAETTPARIRHIPAVLYHWRVVDKSFSQSRHDTCVAAARRAIGDFLAASGVADRAEIMDAPRTPGWTRVKWKLPATPPRVTLIVPTRNRGDLLRRCVDGVLQRTDYSDLELLIMDNESDEPATLELLETLKKDARVRVIPFPGAFNYSAVNNAAVREATGEIVVLLNNDVDVIEGDWLRELVSQALRPDVGAVGARLLFPNDTVQHAGVVLGVGSFAGGPGVAGHFGLHSPASDIGYFGQTGLTREVSAATGACLALRTSVYESVGGLDEVNLPIAFNDVDLCLRIREQGLRIVFTPFAQLYHLESASRGSDIDGAKARRFNREASVMRARWGRQLDNDPFFNVNFSRYAGGFQLAVPARRIPPWMRDPVAQTFEPDDIVDG